MSMLKKLKIIFRLITLTIFVIQAFQSLDKYFQYPVVFQESETAVENIEKPDVQVCFKGFYDYGKAPKYGYPWRSGFLAGRTSNTTKPTWKGINRNSTFQQIQDDLYERDFSKVMISNPNKLKYIYGKGFCMTTADFGKLLEISSKEKNMKVYLVHNTTNSRIIVDQKPNPLLNLVVHQTKPLIIRYIKLPMKLKITQFMMVNLVLTTESF